MQVCAHPKSDEIIEDIIFLLYCVLLEELLKLLGFFSQQQRNKPTNESFTDIYLAFKMHILITILITILLVLLETSGRARWTKASMAHME